MQINKKKIIIFILLIWPNYAFSKSEVWIQNNTKYELDVGDISNWKGGLASNRWSANPVRIGPGKRVRILSFSRAKGVKKGKTYVFDAKVWPVGLPRKKYSPLTLRQWIKGTAFHSKLTYTLRGISPKPGDNTNRSYHSAEWKPLGDRGRRYRVDFRSYNSFGRTDDDVEYVFTDIRKFKRDPSKNKLSILSYNIAMLVRPFLGHKAGKRAQLIANRLKGHDVIVFNEMMSKKERKRILNRIKDEYPHQSFVLNPGGVAVDTVGGPIQFIKGSGGVVIVSRWPFVGRAKVLQYSICKGTDCRARKGAIKVTINKKGQPYHIVGTHMDADDTSIMIGQASELKRFVDELNIPSSEPVLYVGDFNADSRRPTEGYETLIDVLNASVHANVHPFICSFDYRNNSIAGNVYALFSSDPNQGACRDFDHVLYSTDHLAPIRLAREVLMLRSRNGYMEIRDRENPRYGLIHFDLSDHYPVLGTVQLRR